MNVDRSRAGSNRDRNPERELRRVHANLAALRVDVDTAADADVPLTKIESVASNTILMNASGDSASPSAMTVGDLGALDTSVEEDTLLLGRDKDGNLGKLSLANLRALLGL